MKRIKSTPDLIDTRSEEAVQYMSNPANKLMVIYAILSILDGHNAGAAITSIIPNAMDILPYLPTRLKTVVNADAPVDTVLFDSTQGNILVQIDGSMTHSISILDSVQDYLNVESAVFKKCCDDIANNVVSTVTTDWFLNFRYPRSSMDKNISSSIAGQIDNPSTQIVALDELDSSVFESFS